MNSILLTIKGLFLLSVGNCFYCLNNLSHNSIKSYLYLSQTINDNIGSTKAEINIPAALADKFDIVEVILLLISFFALGRLYQIWKFQRILKNKRGE